MGFPKTEQRKKRSRNGGRGGNSIFHKGILQSCAGGDLLLPLLPPDPGSSWTCTHVDAHAHTPRSAHSPLAALRLSCSLPRAPFPLFSIFKSYRSCKVPHQSSFKISTKSQIFSREPSVIPSCQVPSFKFFRPP